MTPGAVEVTQQGFNLLNIPGVTPTTLVGAVGVLLVAWTKFRKVNNDGDASLRTDLMALMASERTECAARLASMQTRLDDLTLFIMKTLPGSTALPADMLALLGKLK